MLNDIDYPDLCARIDLFIDNQLEVGDFAPSPAATELVHVALIAEFPSARDLIATFWDRIAARGIQSIECLRTGEMLLSGIRLRQPTPLRPATRGTRGEDIHLTALMDLMESLNGRLEEATRQLATAAPGAKTRRLIVARENLATSLALARELLQAQR